MNGEMYPKQFFPLDGVILNEVKDPCIRLCLSPVTRYTSLPKTQESKIPTNSSNGHPKLLNPLPLHSSKFSFTVFSPKIACQAPNSSNPLRNNNIPLHVSYTRSSILNIEVKKNKPTPQGQGLSGITD
jgi:hypothetical protein